MAALATGGEMMEMVGEEEEEEEIDELQERFEGLEASTVPVTTQVEGYEALIANARVDDKALKIKEQCIYR